ncbi:MAG TPA: glycine cleavage T C-terminal barrel domain-containing protein [Pirellulaceae bacterium]|nr:glycine cleavage T C-terminal barrel domain-containing protein [Pirellulaceae bacterium]
MKTPLPWLGQYEALTGGVGCVDVSARSRLELCGEDRVRFLNSFCTNDIQRLAAGNGCEAFVTSHQGKTVGHIFVWCTPNALLLDAVAGQAAPLIVHFDRFVISDDVTFHDRTDATFELLVAGPQARELLSHATGTNVAETMWNHQAAAIAGQDVRVCRVDFLRPDSHFVVGPLAGRDAVRDVLLAAGAVPCGAEAVEAVRLESGIPLFGSDITDENLPQEIRRDPQAISFTKGCYLGQETVARIDAMGHVNQFLAGVRFEAAGNAMPAAGAELRSGDNVVGHVTSAAWSPRLKQPLGLALIRRAFASPDTRLDSPSGQAEVVSLPLGP